MISFATGSGLSPAQDATLSKLDTLTEDVSGLRFTTKALEAAPAGGGGGSADWTAAEKNQIRHRLGIDGTAAAPTATPSLARPSDIPTASQNATQVRTELSTELGRIAATVSSRLASAGYSAPPSASAIRTEIDANSTKLDVAVSTRLATAGYTAPANSDVAAIKSKTDQITVTSGLVQSHAQTVADKSDYSLSDAERIAVGAQARVEVERDDGMLDKVKTNTDLIPGLF